MEKKLKLLILEDDQITQRAYFGIFSKSNDYELLMCKDDREFYNAVGEHDVDIFLVDLGLSQSKDGLQIIKEIRNMDKYKTSPIIVVSAFTMLKDEKDCKLAGATKFIRKPFELNELRSEFKKIASTYFAQE